ALGLAAIPPVMRDTGFGNRGFAGSEGQVLARDAGAEPAAQHCEFLGEMRVEMLSDHRRSRSAGQVRNAGAIAPILRASQDHRISAGAPVLKAISAARHGGSPRLEMAATSYGCAPAAVSPRTIASAGLTVERVSITLRDIELLRQDLTLVVGIEHTVR